MTAIRREAGNGVGVCGIAVDAKGKTLNIRARKAVIVATGGSTGNVNFRRMFDPRLTVDISRARRHAVVGSGRQRRNRRHGGRRLAVGVDRMHTGSSAPASPSPSLFGCQYGRCERALKRHAAKLSTKRAPSDCR